MTSMRVYVFLLTIVPKKVPLFGQAYKTVKAIQISIIVIGLIKWYGTLHVLTQYTYSVHRPIRYELTVQIK